MRRMFGGLALMLGLAGCGAVDSMRQGFQHANEVAADLETSVGTKPLVGFNWANGSLVNVNITFEGIPPGASLERIALLSKRSVAARFRQAPGHVVISFAVPGG